jgi:hypothetical protein
MRIVKILPTPSGKAEAEGLAKETTQEFGLRVFAVKD